MANTSDFRNGLTIKFKDDIWSISEFQHVNPGKGAAFVRTKLKNLQTGKVLDNTFPAGSKIDIVRVERKTYQYLYNDGDLFHFMDTSTYEQIPVSNERVGDHNKKFIKDEMVIEMLFNTEDDTILTIELPQYEEYEITYTEPGIKGDTATNTLKPATIETGAEIRVPLFINIGDRVKVETASGNYMERVKS